MALFKKSKAKDKRIAELEAENRGLRNQVEYLIRTIRQTDDIIYSMGQCTEWKTMQPRFAQLHDQMTHRKVTESNRIGSLITEELRKTYNEENNALKRITNV